MGTMAGIKLPKNACPIIVQSMVNPGIFWVTEPADEEMSEEREKLQILEESLQKHCKPSSYSKLVRNYLPEVGELVAVEHPDTKRWHRAKVNVICHLVSGYLYDVFLVDCGISLKVRSNAIKELTPNWHGLNYQSYQVILYGVVPITLDVDYNDDMKMKQVISSYWTPASVRYTSKLLNECSDSFVVCHKLGERKVYGDLYLQTKTGLVSLKENLCNDKYAILDEEHFRTAIGLTKETLMCGVTDSGSSSSTSTDGGSVSRIFNHNSKTIKIRSIRDYLNESVKKEAKLKAAERRQLNENVNVEVEEDIDELMGIEKSVGRGYLRKKRKEYSSNKKRLHIRSEEVITNYDLQDLYEADKKFSECLLEKDKKCSVQQKPFLSMLYTIYAPKSMKSKTKSDENVESVDNHDKNSVKSVDSHDKNSVKSVNGVNVNGQTEEKLEDCENLETQFSSLLKFVEYLPK